MTSAHIVRTDAKTINSLRFRRRTALPFDEGHAAVPAGIAEHACPAVAAAHREKWHAEGGAFDVVGRIVAAQMGQVLGQSVIVENTTGAGGIVGVTRVVNAKPDGYTFLLGTVGTHAYNQTIYRKRRYDAIGDFTPVTLFSEQPMVLEVRKDLAANSFAEFVALLKRDGAKMQYGSAGAGSTTHLACSLLNARIGAAVTHVPYRGSAPATNDLIGGQIDYVCGNLGAAIALIKGKQV